MESEIMLSDCSLCNERYQHESTTVGTDCNVQDTSLEITPPSRYLYEGVWHESMQALLEAMRERLRFNIPKELMQALLEAMRERLRFNSPRELTQACLERSARQLYRRYLQGAQDGLHMHEFKGLAASLAAGLGMDPLRFGNFSKIFHRFDVNADGKVDEDESVMLTESMFRHFQYSLHPRTPGGAKLLDLEFKNVETQFCLSERVGQGGQGTVFIASEIDTKRERVIKIYDKKNTNAPLEEIKAEFMLLKSLDHPKIQRLYDIFEDYDNVYVVAEPYRGGDLRDVVDRGMDAGVNITTGWIARIMIQVMQGIAYLHGKYVIHCDLKESNVMIASADDWREPSAVVIDFGMARNFAVEGDSGGTAGYMPPEVWKHRLWTAMGDVFALGVVMFQIFANGEKCFKGSNKQEVMHATCEAKPNFEVIRVFWRRNGLDLLPLLEAMLQKEFRVRPTIKQCMGDTFFVKRLMHEDDNEQELSEHVVSALSDLSGRNWCDVRRAFASDIAARLNLLELRDLNTAFETIDKDHDGVISDDDMRKALERHLEADDVEKIVEKLVGANGRVPYTMFMGQLIASEVANCTELLRHEFKQLDKSGCGTLSRRDVAQLLEKPALSQVVGRRGSSSIMAVLDANSDDRVSFLEFHRALGGDVGNARLSSDSSALRCSSEFDENLECDSAASNGAISFSQLPPDTENISISRIWQDEEKVSSELTGALDGLARPTSSSSSTASATSSNSKIKDTFKAIDLNSDGKLSFDELFALLSKGNAAFQEDEAWRLFKAIDRNSNGEIEFDEFVNYVFDNEEFAEKAEAERLAVEEERDAKAIVLAKCLQMRAEASKHVHWNGGDWRKLSWRDRLKVIIDLERSGHEKECWT